MHCPPGAPFLHHHNHHSTMQVALLLLKTLLVASLAGVLAQNAPGEVQVDPNAQCEQGVRDQITACLDQVETDESQLSGGPCTSSDWECICTKQQGMVGECRRWARRRVMLTACVG